jgi:imidazolonepropionase
MKLIGPFSQLITLRATSSRGPLSNEELDIITDAGILYDKKTIIEVDSFLELVRKHMDAEVIELEGEYVGLPGMIDCHTHLLWGGSRAGDFEKRNSGVSYQQILKEGGGIMDTVAKTRAASDEELVSSLKQRIHRHLNDGITTIEVKTGYGLNVEQELRFLRLINSVNDIIDSDLVPTFLGAHVCPKEFEKKEYLDLLLSEAIPEIVSNSLTNRVDIFVEPEAFDEKVSEYYLDKISAYGFNITIHGGQFTPEGAVLALKHNAVSVDHLEKINEKESHGSQ